MKGNAPVSSRENEILSVELPNIVELEIVDCEPAVRGDTAQSATRMQREQMCHPRTTY